MAEAVSDKIKNYKTAPFDARFPNTNQTRNCFQNYLGEDCCAVITHYHTLTDQNCLNTTGHALHMRVWG